MTMLVVDSTILAEVLKPEPNEDVLLWAREHASSIFTTAITLKDLYARVLALPDEDKKIALQNRIDSIVRDEPDRILSFDALAATLSSSLEHALADAGITASTEATMIAAICKRHDASVVTMKPETYEHLNIVVCTPE